MFLTLFVCFYLIPLSINSVIMVFLLAKLFKTKNGENNKYVVILKSIPIVFVVSLMSYWSVLLFAVGVMSLYNNEELALEMIQEGRYK